MIEVRSLDSLGGADHGWMLARHHFSYRGYYDPLRMGWGKLRVLNEKRLRANAKTPRLLYRHANVVTYVCDGALVRRNHLGQEIHLGPGQADLVAAGQGIEIEEWNTGNRETHLFRFWIEPNTFDHAPEWHAVSSPFDPHELGFTPLATGKTDSPDTPLHLDQDAEILMAKLPSGGSVKHATDKERIHYLVPAQGRVKVNDIEIPAHAGAAIREVAEIRVEAMDDTDVLLTDLPPIDRPRERISTAIHR